VVRVQEGRCTILDLDSRNGTFVNRVPVKERELENGDEVRIGEYVFLFLVKVELARLFWNRRIALPQTGKAG
jgi:pSer/pThr/pTyr-binding forkhead associated (FHA) protein